MVAGAYSISGGGRYAKFFTGDNMSEFFYQTYMIALPVILTALLGYIVWMLKEQKSRKRLMPKKEMPESKLRNNFVRTIAKVQCFCLESNLLDTIINTQNLVRYRHMNTIILMRCMMYITNLAVTARPLK